MYEYLRNVRHKEVKKMSKVYTSNLTYEQFELIKPLLPPAKKGGRPHCVCMF